MFVTYQVVEIGNLTIMGVEGKWALLCTLGFGKEMLDTRLYQESTSFASKRDKT
jgi:hypothetical protein